MTDIRGSTSTEVDNHILHKQWDEILCPVCMDHPHNAVLLLCSSYEKGCRSYICDTSYRHSNCLDRFKNQRESHPQGPHFLGDFGSPRHGQRYLRPVFDRQRRRRNLTGINEVYNLEETGNDISTHALEAPEETIDRGPEMVLETQEQERMDFQEPDGGGNPSENSVLKCPLCRGIVLGSRIDKEVRQYLDLKPRSCSRESCTFSGNYRDLRRHARRVHPTTRPTDVDPSRQREWCHLEHEREIGDVISALRSASPGAIVIGDYVIESGDGLPRDRENSGSGGGNRPWWTTFFLLQMLRGPLGPLSDPRSSARLGRTRRRSRQRSMWDLNVLDLQDDENDDEFLDSEEIPVPRRRRRFLRSRTEDDNHER